MDGTNRFLGFADIYDEGRPKLPTKTFEILKRYKKDIDLVVDIGCGTGNSSEICAAFSKRVIGIDPSKDMIAKAKTKENSKLQFKEGFGNNTLLNSNIADIVIISQAFHWMEPESTIQEACRILKKGGIFVVIDRDTFPVIDLRLEKYNSNLQDMIQKLDTDQDLIIYPSSEHFNNIKRSNQFEYCKEICFSDEITYNKDLFKKYFLSKGGLQNAIKNNYELVVSKLKELDSILDEVFGGKELNALFSCKMRIGIK